MNLTTVIFDMDGLLIDSEPLWNEAVCDVFKNYDIYLDKKQLSYTTGLRTKEFIEWWFTYFKIDLKEVANAETKIIALVTDKIINYGRAQAGLSHILNFFITRKFKIGLASSSPEPLINTVIDYLGIRSPFQAISSAAELKYGKPHPEVYLECASKLDSSPRECLAFEDSFNGMIAVKAAKMKCVVVPASWQLNDLRWQTADLKISSLQNFNELLLNTL